MTSKPSIFVLMPFSDAFRDVYVLGIRAAAEALGMSVSRVDEQIFHRESILQRIYSQIEESDIIIAEMTGQNSNVFYEVGYAHAKNKRCILITSYVDDIPFDLRHHRHIVYESSIATLKERLIHDLTKAEKDLKQATGLISVAVPYVSGEYRRYETYDGAKVEFRVDVHNNSTTHSEIVEAFYLYTRKKISLTQDGIECPFTASDIDGYVSRYLIRPPAPSIPRMGWIQVKLLVNIPIIAFSDRRQQQYKWKFHFLVRIVGSNGNYNHVLSEDIEITNEEISF